MTSEWALLSKKDIVTKLTEMPRPVSDKIVTMKLPEHGQLCYSYHHECSKNVSRWVEGKIYRAYVLSSLIYGAAAWTVYRRQVNKLRTELPYVEDLLI